MGRGEKGRNGEERRGEEWSSKGKKKTYHPPRERKQHAQRIQREHDDPAERGHEARREPDGRDDEEPDAEEDVVVRGRGCAAVGLGGDEVAREAEDEDREEELWGGQCCCGCGVGLVSG